MNNQQSNQSTEQQAAFLYCYLTVAQFCEEYKAFRAGGLRAQIFHENTNGLKESGAIVRNGRKVLINPPKYFSWMESQNKAVA